MTSPNWNERNPAIPLQYILIHYTDMQSAQDALQRLCSPEAQVSAHIMIDEDGSITRLVAPEKRAWHAGQSFWRGITDMNSASIGIELVNPGHTCGYRPFPPEQIAALIGMLRDLTDRFSIPRTNILAHSDVAPARRIDPGELFPWKLLAEAGFGLWAEDSCAEPPAPDQVAALLSKIGYAVDDIPAALKAFQRHFVPECLTGEADAKTLLRLAQIAQI